MIDMENVIKALEICVGETDFSACIEEECPYIGGSKNGYCITNLERDALALLKEQEAQSVLSNRVCEAESFRYVRKGFCPKCHQEMEWLFNRKHCGFCGQAVKWE